MPGFKTVRGLQWPAKDRECMAVVFDSLPDLRKAISSCPAKRVAVQAGGNAGVWPKEMAKHFESVYTFEPDADNFACLEANCSEPNITKFNAALGNSCEPVDLVRDPANIGAHYVKPGNAIKTMRVDDLALDACDLIQLDVEGYEHAVIEGAKNTIERFGPVVMVEDKGLSERYGVAKGNVLKSLQRLGYRIVANPHRDFILTRSQACLPT